jgi:lysophospholipase L1-like esterase
LRRAGRAGLLVVARRPRRASSWRSVFSVAGEFQEANREFLAAQQSSVFRPSEEMVRRVARQGGATLLDLSEDFTEPRTDPLYVDDRHPNEVGHRIIAERLARLVQADRRAPGR